MGKKKNQQSIRPHVQQSMAQMVSNAAIARLKDHFDQTIKQSVQRLGSQVATQTAGTLEMMFSRIIVLEKILMEKYDYTEEDLAIKVADVEDEREGLTVVDLVELGDVVRTEIRTKKKDQEEFDGSSKKKIYDTGTGKTFGKEIEETLLGMKVGETKTVEIGKNKELIVELSVGRISRPQKEESTEETKVEDSKPVEETNNESPTQG